jgi:predicted O-methyltransferase YrrM
MTNKIIEILEKHQINGFNHRGGTDKASDHSYDNFYAESFESYLNKKTTILEIGVQYGGSSLLWHDYLPQSQLVLVDIKNQVNEYIFSSMNPERYVFYEIDAFKDENLKFLSDTYPEGFDIIVEDGPHSLDSQIYTLQNYLPLLKENGILIIEDIQDGNYVKILMESIKNIEHKSIELVDLRHIKRRYDDLLIVVKK